MYPLALELNRFGPLSRPQRSAAKKLPPASQRSSAHLPMLRCTPRSASCRQNIGLKMKALAACMMPSLVIQLRSLMRDVLIHAYTGPGRHMHQVSAGDGGSGLRRSYVGLRCVYCEHVVVKLSSKPCLGRSSEVRPVCSRDPHAKLPPLSPLPSLLVRSFSQPITSDCSSASWTSSHPSEL